MNTYIAGVGQYLPEKVVSSEELELQVGYKKFGLKPGLCEMLSGCKTRHFAAPDEACSDLATHAGREAMERAGVTADEVDAVLFCSVTQDFAEPATANVVANNLDILNGYCFDVKNACNAFLQGVDIADSLIKTGKARNVLVVSGEVFSRWIKLDEYDYKDIDELKHAIPVALSLADGAGAFLISACPDPHRGIQKTVFHTEPRYWDNNVMWGGGVIYPRDPEKMYIPGTTQKIVAQTGRLAQKLLPEVAAKTGWDLSDVDYLIPTQGATWLVSYISKMLGIDKDRIINLVDHIGNVGASNTALALHSALEDGLVQEGSRVLLISGAVGMSYAAISAIL